MSFFSTVLSSRYIKPALIDLDTSDIDVYLVLGQSNAGGLGNKADLTTAQQQPITGSLIYDNKGTKSLQVLQAGVNTQATGNNDFGAEVMFSIARAAHSNKPFCIIKYHANGTALFENAGSDWNANTPELALTALTIVNEGMAKIRETYNNPKIKNIFWHQGESDSGIEERRLSYASNMDALVDYFDTNNTDMATSKWVMCRIFENDTAGNKALLNIIKEDHVNTNPTRFYWQSPVEHYGRISAEDTTHANAAGQLEMGQDWFDISLANNII